jgi:hypothetical protein
MKYLFTFILFLLLGTLLYANAVIVEWKAEPAENKVILQWKTSQEINVQKFVIEKSSDNRNYMDIGEIAARGPGYQYQFEDNRIGRVNSLFYYRLRIVNNDGTNQQTDSLPVILNISSIVRTWGSIKALFR